MTSLLTPALPDVAVPPAVGSQHLDRVEHGALALLLLWWSGPMTHATGGRDGWATAVALLLLVPVLLTTRPWRRAPRTALVLSLLVPLGALAMCLFSPSGWFGADVFATYVLVSLLMPALLAYARTPARRAVLVGALPLAGLLEFAYGFLAWWGGGDPSHAMVGTFYWWNPYAAYLLVPALLGVGLVVNGARPWVLVGWVATPFCAAGILLSSSRSTAALLAGGSVAVILLMVVVTPPGARRPVLLGRGLALMAVCAGLAFALTGPPFFDHRAQPTASASQRAAAGETVAANSGYRLQFWKRAVAVLEDRPLLGSGAHTLAAASDSLVMDVPARSNYAHDAPLQALAEGGLQLGGPFVLGLLLAAAGLLMRLLHAVRRRPDESWLAIVLPVAGLASIGHSLVDFDWTYPAGFVMSAVVVGLGLSVPVSAPRTPGDRGRWALLVPVTALGLVAVAVMSSARWHATDARISAVRGTSAQVAAQLRSGGEAPFADQRWASALLQRGSGVTGALRRGDVPTADLVWAVGATASYARVDGGTDLLRARALVLIGRPAEAVADVQTLLTAVNPIQSDFYRVRAADVLVAAGEPSRASGLLLTGLLHDSVPALKARLLDALLGLPGAPSGVLAQCAHALVPTTALLTTTHDPGPVPPGTDCGYLLKESSS